MSVEAWLPAQKTTPARKPPKRSLVVPAPSGAVRTMPWGLGKRHFLLSLIEPTEPLQEPRRLGILLGPVLCSGILYGPDLCPRILHGPDLSVLLYGPDLCSGILHSLRSGILYAQASA